jgi:hypothetical protein
MRKNWCYALFSKNPSFSIMILFLSIKTFFMSQKIGQKNFLLPKHPSLTLLASSYNFITKCTKFLLPSLDQWKLVITSTMLKILLVSNWNFMILNTQHAKKETFKNWVSCHAHHLKGYFTFFTVHTSNKIVATHFSKYRKLHVYHKHVDQKNHIHIDDFHNQ